MKYFLLFGLFCFCTPLALAGQGWGAGVSYIYSQMNYKEPAIMSEKGKMSGVGVDTRFNLTDSIALNLQGKFLRGNLEYAGSTFSGTPITQTTKDQVNEFRGLLSLKSGRFNLYSGYGHRYWLNDLVISYRRETTYHYVPIGLRVMTRPFYLNYEFRHFLDGVNVSHMSDIGGGRKDVTMKQKSGKGYAFEIGHLTHIGSFDLKIALGYEYWGIENSVTANDGVDTLIEPHNSTNTYSLSAGLYF